MPVEADWIDYNGHLNMAYYNVLFYRGADELVPRQGVGIWFCDRDRDGFVLSEGGEYLLIHRNYVSRRVLSGFAEFAIQQFRRELAKAIEDGPWIRSSRNASSA